MTPNDLFRRRLLRYIATSPFLSLLPSACTRDERSALANDASAPADPESIAKLEDALDVFDLESIAARNVPPAHWGNLVTGSDDDQTLRLNCEELSKLQIRPRRFVDVRTIDTSLALFGRKLESPLILCPVSSERAFHPEGELATAKAAAARGHLMVLSALASSSYGDVARTIGDPWKVWFQLYPTNQWNVAREIVAKTEAAGCEVLVLSADIPVRGNRETQMRWRRKDARPCASCHGNFDPVRPTPDSVREWLSHHPAYEGIDTTNVTAVSPALTWDLIAQIKRATKMKLVLKGVCTAEDAHLAIEHGADGIWISNHGGRQENSGLSTIECLPEIVEEVKGRVPVILDGGVRRGTDIFKGIALGATAVGIGRPHIWGLAAFGAPGVEQVLKLLDVEFQTTMRLSGAPSLAAITRAHVRRRPV